MANRTSHKTPLTGPSPKSAVAKAKPRSGGRFTPVHGKTITAASAMNSAGGPPTGGKSAMSSYYNTSKRTSTARVRKPLPAGPLATPTRAPQPEKRMYTGGKHVPGYTPSVFGSGRNSADSDDEDESEADDDDEYDEEEAPHQPIPEANEWEDEEEDGTFGAKPPVKHERVHEEDSEFQPESDVFEDINDDDAELDFAVVEQSNHPRRGSGNRGGRGGSRSRSSGSPARHGSYASSKVHYKKKIRKDASRFTTTTAMIDADDEFHPKVAAIRGRTIVGSGNGRKGGRKLIRWTPSADQLLLLCFHHELSLTRDDLPYEQVAQRMFPEKCATGGAVKERFAKLRIEMLNRGSWVPPIIGKAPQGLRPNVRGVVRVAPGIDKGRYVLWKEDASKLIDPKDIMKGHADAQGRGQEAPGRVWICREAQLEFLAIKKKMEDDGLQPLANSYDEDDHEVVQERRQNQEADRYAEDEEQDEEGQEVDDELVTPNMPMATPSRKRKALPSYALPPSSKRNTGSRAPRKAQYRTEDDDVFGVPGDGSPRPKTRSRGRTPLRKGSCKNDELLANLTRESAPSPESPGEANGGIMSFEPAEKTLQTRRVLVLSSIPSRVLAKFPAGQSGPGEQGYFLDEVFDKAWFGEKNPGMLAVDLEKMQLQMQNKEAEPLPPNEDPNNILFNTGITLPSAHPFWLPIMDIPELMSVADKIVDEITRPAEGDILKQVFDGAGFWNVDEIRGQYKANTNPDNGLPLDMSIWYKCATILRIATMGHLFDAVKAKAAAQVQAPAAKNFEGYNLLPDQHAMNMLNAQQNALGMNPIHYGDAVGDINEGGYMAADNFFPNHGASFVQNNMEMDADMLLNAYPGDGNGQHMLPSGDMGMGNMNHHIDGDAAMAMDLYAGITDDQMNDMLEFPVQDPVDGGHATDDNAFPELKTEEQKPDVQMS